MASLSGPQVAQVAYEAGFRGEDLVKMVGIARRESGWQPDAHRTDRDRSALSGDLGLWQINYVHHNALIRDGVIGSKQDLFDPVANARAAMWVFQQQGWNGWTAGPGGWTEGGNALHGVNINTARQAVTEAQTAGLLGQSFGGTMAETGDYSEFGPTGAGGATGTGPIRLPSDATVVTTAGYTMAVFDVGGINIYYDMARANVQYDQSQVQAVSPEQWESMNAIDAGRVEELSTLSASFDTYQEFWDSIVGNVMGYNNPARNDPGVLRVLAEFAGRPDMTEAELQNRLQATEWFQERTSGQLEWNSISEAERQKRLAETSNRLNDILFQFAGVRPGSADPRVANYIEQVASGQMGIGAFTEIVKSQASTDPESPWSRQARSEQEEQRQRPVDIENTSQRIRETTERWGLQWSNETITKWAKGIVENHYSDEDLVKTLRDQAQVLFPWKDPETETATAAAPWLETYRRTMEQSATVNTSEVQKALVAGQTPWELEQELKNSDAWMGTKNGQDQIIGVASEMGRRMGFEL